MVIPIVIILFICFYLLNNILKNYNKTDNFKNLYNNPPFPIDIVYTWRGEKFSNNIRESYNYELKYSLRSIDLYAPWVNKIYILMNESKYPSWVNPNNNKIIIVDHATTFKDKKYLPNTNSNAIETTIINIPNLSEHYIYFCDDVFLGRPCSYTEFFTFDGKAKVDIYTKVNNSMLKNKNVNLLNFELPNTTNRFHPHIPIPQIKSSVIDFYNTYPEYIEWIKSTKSRKGTGFDICRKYQLNMPCQQIHYPTYKHMYSQNKAILIDNNVPNRKEFIMNNNMYNKTEAKLDKLLRVRPLFFCINDDEKDPIKRIKVRNDMLNFFNKYYPNKASFEY